MRMQLSTLWCSGVLLQFLVGISVSAQDELNDKADTVTLGFGPTRNQLSEEVLRALRSRGRMTCRTRRRSGTTTAVSSVLDTQANSVPDRAIEAIKLPETSGEQIDFGESKPQAFFLEVKRGVDYHYRCPHSRSGHRVVEWKAQKHWNRYGVQHIEVENVYAFGIPQFRGERPRPRPWTYSNFFLSHWCMQIGDYYCQYTAVGHYRGEVWPQDLTMVFITSHEDPVTAPYVQETCQYNVEGEEPGESIANFCDVDWIDVYPLED